MPEKFFHETINLHRTASQSLFEINVLAKDGTNWYIWGNQEGADAPAFTDQS